MSAVLRSLVLVTFVAVAYSAGRTDTGQTAPCRGGLL